MLARRQQALRFELIRIAAMAVVLARYRSDATLAKTAPHRYRKISDRQIRVRDRTELLRWLRNPDFDPVFRDWHKHEANRT